MLKRLAGIIILFILVMNVSVTFAGNNSKARIFTDVPQVTGTQAHFSTMASVTLPAQAVNQRYAIEMTPKDSCIIAYHAIAKLVGGATTYTFTFYDFCNDVSYVRDVKNNTAFRDLYVRVQNYTEPAGAFGSRVIQDETFIPRIEKTGINTWVASLYNFTTGAWDTKLTATGNDVVEAYVSIYWESNGTPTACSTLGTYGHATIWTTKLQRGIGNAFNLAQFSDVKLLDSVTMYCTNTTGNPWQFVNTSPADQLIIRTPAA